MRKSKGVIIVNNKIFKFIFLGTLSVLVYALITLIIFGIDGDSSFWISFVFAIVSISLAFFTSFLSLKDTTLKDWIFSLPVLRWSIMYVFIEILVSIIFMTFDILWKISFLSQFILLIFFFIVVVPCFFQKKNVKSIDEITITKVSYIRLMYSKLVNLLPRIENDVVKNEIEQAIDLLKHSDPMSSDDLIDIERKLSASVDKLDELVRGGIFEEAVPVAREIRLLISERNQLSIATKMIQY